jgi:histidinol phosphatase-like PHP family hydrolase
MERRKFIKNAGIAGGLMTLSPLISYCQSSEQYDFPLTDLHVHLTDTFTIDNVMELAEKRKVKIGIVEHPAVWAIKDDTDLKNYIEKLRKYPVYIGLQPIEMGWSKKYSPELLSKIDYILMDPQIFRMKNGELMQIWEFNTYVEDTEEFMETYMAHALDILNNEPINIFGWPLFLPVCIARDYYTLWTEKRMMDIIKAAKSRNIAIEINDMSHTPHDKFILMAKENGLKFTFGSDSRNANVGRLDYSKNVAKKCGLKEEDFYKPVSKAL